MSDYCHKKVIRMKIDKEQACRLLKVPINLYIEDSLKYPFEVAPTEEFFIDYVLLSEDSDMDEFGRVRPLYDSEYKKYERIFNEAFGYQLRCYPSDFRVVEYCWYTCSEAPDYFNDESYHDNFYDEV